MYSILVLFYFLFCNALCETRKHVYEIANKVLNLPRVGTIYLTIALNYVNT